MKALRNSISARQALEIGFVCGSGLLIATVIGILQQSGPFGDDSIYYVGTIGRLASDFPHLAWDPHSFAGYVPTLGFSWLTYLPPATLVMIGIDARSSFHVAFVATFLLLGIAVHRFARVAGSGPIISYSMSILAWSSNAYWNITIWGGAYNRAFTVPIAILALATTYEYVKSLNQGETNASRYWLSLALWTATFLGDIFVSLAFGCIGFFFLVSSAGFNDLRVGLERLALIFLPVAALTSWQIVPVFFQAVKVFGYRNVYTIPVEWSWLLVPGVRWQSTLNFVYIPSIAVLCAFAIVKRTRFSGTQKALLFSTSIMAAYWLLMGWVPFVWSFLPRLMATNSSVENLTWIFLIILPLLLTETIGRNVQGRNLWTSITLWRLRLPSLSLPKIIKLSFFLFVLLNAAVLVPSIKPVAWGPLDRQLNEGISLQTQSLSSDYRVSLSNRLLTRSHSFYQPGLYDTGGRVQTQDLSPFYRSWYATDVFYKNDLGSLGAVYIDDRPAANLASLIEPEYNYAGTNFWLDWFAVNTIVFFPYYHLDNTWQNYSARPSLFAVTKTPAEFAPEVFVKPREPSPVLVATNATVVGFYSSSSSASDEYNSFVALLSYLGLGPRYVIPLYLQSLQDETAMPSRFLVTDSNTYSSHANEMQSILNDNVNIAVVSSTDGDLLRPPSVERHNGGVLFNFPTSFSQLVRQREPGTYTFVSLLGILGRADASPSASSTYGPEEISVSPSSWVNTYKSANVNGTLEANSNVLTGKLEYNYTGNKAQFNIDSLLPKPIPLSRDLSIEFAVNSTVDIRLGISFSTAGGCCLNYVGLDEVILGGNWVRLRIPFTEFNVWGNPTSKFGLAQKVTLAINLPTGHTSAIVQFSNVTITSPSYTKSSFTSFGSIPAHALIVYPAGEAQTVTLANESGESSDSVQPTAETSSIVIPFASFTMAVQNQSFDQIYVVGGDQTVFPQIVVFSEPAWSQVSSTWTNNERIETTQIPMGFSGLVWKETYSQQWSVIGQMQNSENPMRYYLAGPKMIYIPTSSLVNSIRISYQTATVESVATALLVPLTPVILALFRHEILKRGLRSQRHATSVERNPNL